MEAVLPTVNVMVFVPASLDFQIASLFVPLKAPVLAVIFLVAVVSLIAKLPLALIKCISERSSVESVIFIDTKSAVAVGVVIYGAVIGVFSGGESNAYRRRGNG